MRSRPLFLSVAGMGAVGLLGYGAFVFSAARQARAAERPQAAPREAVYVPRKKGALTFAKDIAPIVFQNCTGCHRPGEVAPFTLATYQDVKKRAQQIALVTERRLMPPWKATEPPAAAFHDARYLTTEQIGTIRQWVEEGAKPGRAADMPPPPKFTDGWTLGQPDATYMPSESYTLPSEGRDVYRCFVLPTNFAEDRWVSSLEVRPGNRAIVHHVIAYLDTSGEARKLDARDPGPGYSAFGGIGILPSGALGGWAPGNLPRRLPEGVGVFLPKGADIVLQVHYHPSGKAESDQTKIGLYFCDKPVDKRQRILPIVNPFLRIPAGEANYTIHAAMPVLYDATVLEVMPHMHLLGKEMTVTATLPDGADKRLIKVPQWDFNWQTTYAYKEPVKLPRGSKLSLVARYDNSTGNPRNPTNPPRTVTWGEQTTDEMCIAFVFYTVDKEQLTKGIRVDDFFGDLGRRGQGRRGFLRRLGNNGAGQTGSGNKPQ